MKLRAYQQSIFYQVINSKTNDLVQLDTGAGKTPIIAKLAEYYEQVIIVCHRNILIKQASEKLAMCSLHHRIIASRETKKICAANNFSIVNRHFINPRSHVILVSIDTINSQFKRDELRIDESKEYVTLIDEAHHFTDANKWGLLKDIIDGRFVGFTATPCRGDGQPLINQYGGFFERLIQSEGYQGNGTERLIVEGYLSEYKAFYASPAFSNDNLSNYDELALISSAVSAYKQYAKGRQALVIFPLISSSEIENDKFKLTGISSAVIHSQLPQYEIARILSAFSQKKIKVLIAVDMVNEGFDVPDCDVLILAREVGSFGLYRQLCGRVLRPRKGKEALILDLNGASIAKHGLPSDPVNWMEKQKEFNSNINLCDECGLFYNSALKKCPNCGNSHEKLLRGKDTRAFLKQVIFSGKYIEMKRNLIKKEEQDRIKNKEKEKKVYELNNHYIDISISFSKGFIGKRLEFFYLTLRDVLRKKLTAIDYNLFFKIYGNDVKNIEFYSDCLTSDFDNNTESECISLYEIKTQCSIYIMKKQKILNELM